MRKLPTGSSFGAGVLAGLAVTERPLLIFATGLVVGIALAVAARLAGRLGRWVDRLAEHRLG